MKKNNLRKKNHENSVANEKLKAALKVFESSSEKENNYFVADIVQEWQLCQNDMKRRLQKTIKNKENAVLQKTLQNAIDCRV